MHLSCEGATHMGLPASFPLHPKPSKGQLSMEWQKSEPDAKKVSLAIDKICNLLAMDLMKSMSPT